MAVWKKTAGVFLLYPHWITMLIVKSQLTINYGWASKHQSICVVDRIALFRIALRRLFTSYKWYPITISIKVQLKSASDFFNYDCFKSHEKSSFWEYWFTMSHHKKLPHGVWVFPKWGYPQLIHLNRVYHDKPSILGFHILKTIINHLFNRFYHDKASIYHV